MGLLFVERLPGERVYKCRRCRVDAASRQDIVSKDFHGRSGPGLPLRPRALMRIGITGLHTVNDIYCSCCQQILGWRYEKASDESQKYQGSTFWRKQGCGGKAGDATEFLRHEILKLVVADFRAFQNLLKIEESKIQEKNCSSMYFYSATTNWL